MSSFYPTPSNTPLTNMSSTAPVAGGKTKKKPTATNQPQTGMVVTDISPYQVNAAIPVIDAQNSMRLAIRQPGSIYDIAFNAADPQQFAAAAGQKFDELKKTNVYGAAAGFANDLEYLQAAVRNAKGTAYSSKGTSNIGDISLEDYAAIQKVFQASYLRGYDWSTTLQLDLNSPYRSAAGGDFTKNVTTAMHLLDATDAESRLSDAYFKAFGVYPTQKKIESFRTKYNAEAKKQAAVTTTISGTSSTKTTTQNEGFTAAEQQDFLANFLKDNYKITGKEQSGYVTNVIKALKNAYAANMIPEEDMGSMIAFATDLIGTSDSNIQDQKVATKLQSIRNVASKQYQGLSDVLTAGQDASTIVDPIVKTINSTLGINIDRNDSRIKQIVNYNDGKTTRVMNAAEINDFIEKQPEFQTSTAGYNKYASIGQAIAGALK